MHRRQALQALSRPAALALAAGLLGACNRPAPLRLGFLGGLSSKFADLGSEVRNAALLCIEDFNSSTPLASGPVELVDRDDGQDAEKARRSLRELAERGVFAVIGPVTSSMGTAVAPLAAELGLLLVSPTITTARLKGIDDAFVRVCGDTAANGAAAARIHARNWQARRYALIWDAANADYSQSWTEAYAAAAETAGLQALTQLRIDSRQPVDHAQLAAQLLDPRPDLVVLCCSSVDAAGLIQRLRQQDATVRIATSAWASTSRTLELAGRAADGALFEQLYDPGGRQPAYLRFVQTYEERFGQSPSFPGVLSHDATQLLLEAARSGVPRSSLKSALVQHEHTGLQGRYRIDAQGDVQRPAHHLFIRDGRYVASGWTGEPV